MCRLALSDPFLNLGKIEVLAVLAKLSVHASRSLFREVAVVLPHLHKHALHGDRVVKTGVALMLATSIRQTATSHFSIFTGLNNTRVWNINLTQQPTLVDMTNQAHSFVRTENELN